MIKAKRDAINGVVVLLFTTVLFLQIQVIPKNPQRQTDAAFFPKIVIPILGALAICLLVTAVVRMFREQNDKLILKPGVVYRENSKIIWVFLFCAAYLIALTYIGFMISTPIFLLGVYALLAKRMNKLWLVVVGYIALTAVIYIVFQQFLFVFLPTGQLL